MKIVNSKETPNSDNDKKPLYVPSTYKEKETESESTSISYEKDEEEELKLLKEGITTEANRIREERGEEFQYPDQVTDKEAWVDYLSLKGQLEETKQRYFTTSDKGGLIIDLCTSVDIICKMTVHLPREEQDRIIEAGGPFRSNIRKLTHLKRRALGKLQEKNDSSEFSKLTVKQSEIIELFGKFYSVRDVYSIIIRDWGYDINIYEVQQFYKRNRDKIEQIQKEYEHKGHKSIRLTKRRSRLEELSLIYEKLKQKFLDNETDGTAKMMQQVIESIKKEVDGDVVINGKMKIEVEETVNHQVFNDMMRDFNITALIIGRLAGRLNVNPLYIISRLSNSMYSKFTGFSKPEISREEDEINYPSQITYEMERIKELYVQNNNQDNMNKELPRIENKVVNLSLKEKLIEKIGTRQKDLNNTTNYTENIEIRVPKEEEKK